MATEKRNIARKVGVDMKTVKKAEKIAKKEYGKPKTDAQYKKVMGTTKKIASNMKKHNAK